MADVICKDRQCRWYDEDRDVCNSPHDPWKGECDYDWASVCPECHTMIAVGDDDDDCCPYCGAALFDEM